MTHKLTELGYTYDALEPYFDARTMEIHHSKHHAAYVKNLNIALEGYPHLLNFEIEDLLKNAETIPQEIRTAVINNGGGHANHKLFWSILKKDVEPKGEVVDAINKKFGNLENFKTVFTKAAATRFGSGWAWLVVNNKEIEIMSTQNQISPLSHGRTPILTLDVWEHSYYLKFQNKRPEYIETFFKVINWDKVNELYLNAIK